MTAITPCWCWRNNPSGEDACGSCGWPKAHHHDNGYRINSGKLHGYCDVYSRHGACSCSTGVPGNVCPFENGRSGAGQ